MNNWKVWAVSAVGVAVLATTVVAVSSPPANAATVTVYKSPTCGCCAKWVAHLEENGFEVQTVETPDLSAVKAEYRIAPENQACHTAVVDGYVVEGHVPADLVSRMLDERPDIVGLTVPGMPMGSPGMEGPRKDPYTVFALNRDGTRSVYAQR